MKKVIWLSILLLAGLTAPARSEGLGGGLKGTIGNEKVWRSSFSDDTLYYNLLESTGDIFIGWVQVFSSGVYSSVQFAEVCFSTSNGKLLHLSSYPAIKTDYYPGGHGIYVGLHSTTGFVVTTTAPTTIPQVGKNATIGIYYDYLKKDVSVSTGGVKVTDISPYHKP